MLDGERSFRAVCGKRPVFDFVRVAEVPFYKNINSLACSHSFSIKLIGTMFEGIFAKISFALNDVI